MYYYYVNTTYHTLIYSILLNKINRQLDLISQSYTNKIMAYPKSLKNVITLFIFLNNNPNSHHFI